MKILRKRFPINPEWMNGLYHMAAALSIEYGMCIDICEEYDVEYRRVYFIINSNPDFRKFDTLPELKRVLKLKAFI